MNIKKAEKEAERIIKDAKEKAELIILEAHYKTGKKSTIISDYGDDDCLELKRKKDFIREDYKRVLKEIESKEEETKRRCRMMIEEAKSYTLQSKNFLRNISRRKSIPEEQLIDLLFQYLDEVSGEEPIIYRDEQEFILSIKDIKDEIKKMGRFDVYEAESFNIPVPLIDMAVEYYKSESRHIAEKAGKTGEKNAVMSYLKLYGKIDGCLQRYGCKIKNRYADLWIEYIKRVCAHERFKEQRRIEIREDNERKREERKAQLEYERAIKQAEKDEATARRKIEEAQKKLEEQKNNEKKYKELTEQIEKLQQALQDAIQRGERALSMAQQTKKGFVYIISNEDSFGENVYKIGLTRRLDPTERVDELSNASVPFPFSIYTIIESDDAPALEAHLHRKFDEQKINKTNWRKEFFKISKEDIDKALEEENIIVMDKEKYV